MNWLSDQWHKGIILAIAIDRFWDRGIRLWKKAMDTEEFFERRINERRHTKMIDVLSKLSVIDKIVPILEQVVSEIGPTVQVAGADASQVVTDVNKLLSDLKDKIEEIKAYATPPAGTKPA